MTTIPYAGLRAFARIAARTTLARAVLSVALVALVLVTAAAARHPRVDEPQFVPPHAGGIVVLDLSASISTDTFSRIGTTLTRLVARGGRYGLVVFSNTAYEALPVGTPASALKPLIRYFTLQPPAIPGEQPSFPTNPWTTSFTSGTKISVGLALALELLNSDHIKHPAVVLVSDLADDNSDLTKLTTTLTAYKAEHAHLNIVPLNAAPNDEAFFANLLGKATSIIPSVAHGQSVSLTPKSSFPTWLVILTIGVAILLAGNELRSARLRWGGAVEVVA